MSERTVTIIVTVYNVEEHLERFFSCLKAQTYPDFEAVMVDDGSEDNSLAVCREFAASDERIRVIHSEHVGISAARNLAFENIRTPFVTSLDADDYFDKDYLRHLMDAQKKTGADLVLSNVILVNEDGSEKSRFCAREAGLFFEKDFPDLLPALLSEDRLNYLYAKLYKASLLKDVRVETDVMQGSDTMINFKYLKNVRSIAIIEDYDYCYVQYQKRSVTSYMGMDYFERLYRINKFLLDVTEEYEWQNDQMLEVIDCRILHIGKRALERIAKSDDSQANRYMRASEVVYSEGYLVSYHRCKERDNGESFFERYHYHMIVPGEEKAYIDRTVDVIEEEKQNEKLSRLRAKCPDALFNIWHKIRVMTGTARK